jgi:hypothetical protein
MKSPKVYFVTLLLLLGTVCSVWGQEVNPRQLEVEQIIKESVEEYVANILPQSHFLVSVKVTPLRRKEAGYTPKGEILPYFEMSNEEVRDEWDDPTVSIYRLLRRIKHSEIKIIFTSDVKLVNQQQFILDLINYTNLVPTRDIVTIEHRTAIASQSKNTGIGFNSSDIKYGIYLLVFLLGLGGISFFFHRGAQNGNSQTSTASSAPMPSAPMMMPSRQTTTESSSTSGRSLKGDLSLIDPTKTMEIIRTKIDDLLGSGTFPTLNDMIELEKMAMNNPSAFSALVFEFPLTHQQEIFQNGKGDLWYRCFTDGGQIDQSVLKVLDRMLRERTPKGIELFEKLLIQIWRLEDRILSFLEKIDRNDAYAILYYLPKQISIPVGRKLFAGSWGDLVGAQKIPALSDKERIKELLYEAYELKPLLSYQSLEAYKNSRDLLEYLNYADVREEEDIYSVVGKSSDLFTLRPPFFKFFTLDKETRQPIFEQFSLQEWALSIFDTERTYRKILDEHLDDKQKFLLSSFLKEFDTAAPSLEERGRLREAIGRVTHEILIQQEQQVDMATVADSTELESGGENSIDDVE